MYNHPANRWACFLLASVAALECLRGAAADGFRPPAEKSGAKQDDVSGAYYDWTRTKQPERPYLHPYHQTLVMKLFLGWKRANDNRGPNQVIDGCNVFLTFEQALEVIRKLDNLTLGIPKVVYLVGWQHDGHDSKYPDWSVVNPRLKRPQDATAVDSLKWLMSEGFKHHTTVSLHVNMFDAHQDSPLWETYLKHDVIAKDRDGRLLDGEVNDLPGAAPRPGNCVYYISYAREWETGLAQKRIDGLLAMLPVQRAGTIHIDAFHSLRPIPHAYPQERYPDLPKSDTRISPFLNYPLEKEVEAQRKIIRYFRNWGVDVTSEGSTFLRPDAFVGLQAMAWDYQPPAPGIPPSLYCGTPMRAEPEILRDPQSLSGLLEQFCERVVPWYYKNNTTAAKGKQAMRDGDDLCVPALWRKQALVAYSRKGDAQKEWTLPPGWEGVSRVVVSELTLDGPKRLRQATVDNGAFKLSLAPRQGVMISAAPAETQSKRSNAGPAVFNAPSPASFQVRPLPGQSSFVFSIYGVPGELEPLKQIVQVMRDQHLGNAFDPGPTPSQNTKPVFDYLAGVGWPVICYPGCADMQIKGGRCVLGPDNEAALAAMDRARVFTAVQLGEWRYYFHNLSLNEPWWRDVYGKESDAFKHLIDHLAGYNGYMDKPWGILEPTAGDRMVRDLFDHQLYPGSDHIHHKPDPDNPESGYLRPTPYGEMFDVQPTSASAEMLSSYPVILLAGDIEFDDELIGKLESALKQGSALLLTPAHQQALGTTFARLAKHRRTEVLEPWSNPATGRAAAISDLRLQRLGRETLPVEVAGDPIQYEVNRTADGWVIELINNTGVAKKPDQPAKTDPSAIARVVLQPRVRSASAREWRSNRPYPRPDEIRLEVGPGQSAFVEVGCR